MSGPCLSRFVFRYVTKNLINMDQRNDFAQKALRQILILPPCSLRRCVMSRVLLRLRFGGADGLLSGEPPAVSPAIQVPFQPPQRGLVRLLRSAGAVVVEPDRQLLKSHADLVRLADAEVASHQIQLSGRQHLLHPLHQQRPAHQVVIIRISVSSTAKHKRKSKVLGINWLLHIHATKIICTDGAPCAVKVASRV